MMNDKGILIQNIYYMLAYAFQVLRQENYEEVAAEDFDKIEDLFAAILAKGVSAQLKQGLFREYVAQCDDLAVLRGKLSINDTIRHRLRQERLLACEFDEFSENNLLNRILKTTMALLIRERSVASIQKQALKSALLLFDGIDTIEPDEIHWNRIRLQRSNRSYEMLINICRFVLEGMLQTNESGQYKMAAFSDEHMERLYEKFILEYYRQHHPQLHASAAQVKWDLDEDTDFAFLRFLPTMQTDIMLRQNGKTLIIDAKYYRHSMQFHHDSYSVHSGNLYQIFAYVKNQQATQDGNVSGLLLYAKTEEFIAPDFTFGVGGSSIGVKTLDLNKPFKLIGAQLDQIAHQYFYRYSLGSAKNEAL